MRADLQTILNAQNLASGHNPANKQMVLAYLLMRKYVPNVALTMPSVAGKVAGLQGLSETNLLDACIYGLTVNLGLPTDFITVKNLAKNSIDGGGVVSAGQNVNMGEADWITLQNYAMLTICKAINDAS